MKRLVIDRVVNGYTLTEYGNPPKVRLFPILSVKGIGEAVLEYFMRGYDDTTPKDILNWHKEVVKGDKKVKVGDVVVHNLRPERYMIVTAVDNKNTVDCRWWEDRLIRYCSETFGIEELTVRR